MAALGRSGNPDKAISASRSNPNQSVNRRLREDLSPSPSRSPSQSPPPRQRDRPRSRSPYRAPRGEKRRWDDRRHGPASSHDNRRYHDRDGTRHHNDDRQKSRLYQNDDRRYGRSNVNWHDDRDGRGPKKLRARSRSPRSSTGRPRNGSEWHQVRGKFRSNHNGYLNDRQGANAPSRDGRHSPRLDRIYPQTATSKDVQAYTTSRQNQLDNGEKKSQTSIASNGKTGALEVDNDQEDSAPGAEAVNEELSIEERRKRREAIKAKYQTQTSQTIQPASMGNTEVSLLDKPEVSTAASTRSGSFSKSSPDSPAANEEQDVASAVDLSKDEDLIGGNPATSSGAVEGPSAADYDPSQDMQEDRLRDDMRHQNEDVSAQQYDEKEANDKEVAGKERLAMNLDHDDSKMKEYAADDMFASDDDDDMFAPESATKSSKTDHKSAKSTRNTKGRELDTSLLDNWDDPEGYYRIIHGELLDSRYHVHSNLGKGIFSSVIRALDNRTNNVVAIKIIRNNESMIKAGSKEMDILQKLTDADPEDKRHMIRLERSFTHKGHLCMVFENLSINLREVLKKFGRDVGINLKAIRSYAQQMFLGLSLLQKCNILHADLKPDNILVNEARTTLKICDLGSAADASDGKEITPYLVSRFYRAPEVMLGIPYDFGIDMWSVGCTLFELYTGKILFTGRNNNQMLRSMMECRGKFPLKMLKKAEFGAVHFDDKSLDFKSVERDKVTGRDVVRLVNFQRPTRDLKQRVMAAAPKGADDGEMKELGMFVDLLEQCLALNPEKRLPAVKALQHPFLQRGANLQGPAFKVTGGQHHHGRKGF